MKKDKRGKDYYIIRFSAYEIGALRGVIGDEWYKIPEQTRNQIDRIINSFYEDFINSKK